MKKIDKRKLYYLSHPWTGQGNTLEDNKRMEQRCADKIRLSQDHFICRSNEFRNKTKLIRPLALIPENTTQNEEIKKRMALLRICDGIIMCGDWMHCNKCVEEMLTAKRIGMKVYRYEDVVDMLKDKEDEAICKNVKKSMEEFRKGLGDKTNAEETEE